MYLFLIPLLTGFTFNWASAFTHDYSQSLGERAGRWLSFILRNIMGIPVWVYGLAVAIREPSPLLFVPGLATDVLGWMLIFVGMIPMVWGLQGLGLRSFRPTDRDTLVNNGIYSRIRHPIYSGLLLDFLALPLVRPSRTALLACALGWGYVFVQARLEEIDLDRRMPAYRLYRQQVPRFFPRLGKIREADFSKDHNEESH
jgi:protein-S-isoprenylcysteine O-methyltransferase Ste14